MTSASLNALHGVIATVRGLPESDLKYLTSVIDRYELLGPLEAYYSLRDKFLPSGTTCIPFNVDIIGKVILLSGAEYINKWFSSEQHDFIVDQIESFLTHPARSVKFKAFMKPVRFLRNMTDEVWKILINTQFNIYCKIFPIMMRRQKPYLPDGPFYSLSLGRDPETAWHGKSAAIPSVNDGCEALVALLSICRQNTTALTIRNAGELATSFANHTFEKLLERGVEEAASGWSSNLNIAASLRQVKAQTNERNIKRKKKQEEDIERVGKRFKKNRETILKKQAKPVYFVRWEIATQLRHISRKYKHSKRTTVAKQKLKFVNDQLSILKTLYKDSVQIPSSSFSLSKNKVQYPFGVQLKKLLLVLDCIRKWCKENVDQCVVLKSGAETKEDGGQQFLLELPQSGHRIWIKLRDPTKNDLLQALRRSKKAENAS